ncbi:hypothetical protein [Methanobacterium sp.]|uniref:hypothetical protein n=1 Tax=Methanobacterium sp. TaxID=2164 RepID=UPI002AB92C3B|nr:hypothetical protein [Methanobacterium sp.]MDY9922765.1 hypothetical protein [Methanobacterium sp.]
MEQISQSNFEESQGILWNAKEEILDENLKKATEIFLHLSDELGSGDLYNILDKIWELTRFEPEIQKFIYDIEGFEFLAKDVTRALDRESKIKRYHLDKKMHHGGRPSEIKHYHHHYKLLKNGGESYIFNDLSHLMSDAKQKLSRTSFWRLKKEINNLKV